jgi:hypothetical protein
MSYGLASEELSESLSDSSELSSLELAAFLTGFFLFAISFACAAIFFLSSSFFFFESSILYFLDGGSELEALALATTF